MLIFYVVICMEMEKIVKEKFVAETKKDEGFGLNDSYVEMLRSLWLANPTSVPSEWQEYFSNTSNAIKKVSSLITQQSFAKSEVVNFENKVPLLGIQKKIAQNMTESILVPTATSVRQVAAKILEENRSIINNYLEFRSSKKCSFTHIIAYFIVKSLKQFPMINNSYTEESGPTRIEKQDVNLGIAIDLQGKDGYRALVVPSIKSAEQLNFKEFFNEYNALVDLAHKQKLEPKHFLNTSITLTNPGTLGTVLSNPRLMRGQGAIIATGTISYPAEYEAASLDIIENLGISKIMTISCTYDHRIIQGAESGRFLAYLHELLNGEHNAYEEIFDSLGIFNKPYNLKKEQNIFNNHKKDNKEAKVQELINAYRTRGHLLANLDPLKQVKNTYQDLDLHYYGLNIWDLDKKFTVSFLQKPTPLKDILKLLNNSYCNRMSIEYMYIDDHNQRIWIQNQVEQSFANIDENSKKNILWSLLQAEMFEQFLHKRYVGYKRFSLEGAESLIPLLSHFLEIALSLDIKEVFFGMAHRGRLNVLSNIFKKPYEAIFSEFEDLFDKNGNGDVKYHLGAFYQYQKDNKSLNIKLAYNPSHLEAINPVVQGMTRALQDYNNDVEKNKYISVLIHGDAAFAGQGVVYETLQMSKLEGYSTNGTIHIVINNQIGYTAEPSKSRSTKNCTDIAKFLSAPVIRVNGDDPEICLKAIEIAFAYKKEFNSDVVIDLVCYRRYGHNEGDEPSFTQPLMYNKIKEHSSVASLYSKKLLDNNIVNSEELENIKNNIHNNFENAYNNLKKQKEHSFTNEHILKNADDFALTTQAKTFVSKDLLLSITTKTTTINEDFNINPKVEDIILHKRNHMLTNKDNAPKIDFGAAEILAYGSLLTEGVSVRISGQDSSRGTFAHRHAVLYDIKTAKPYIPLQNLNTDKAKFYIYDSLLSEEAVLGFEYGYSVAHPRSLVIWEAQFGDFFNGAQIQVDQFIAAAEEKWDQTSRLVMMLPHGYDGQGPEHSSGRIERFLQLCAQNNLRVCNCSTSAQLFHLLRKQALEYKKPLVIFTHKSLLRAEEASCVVNDLIDGAFKTIIADDSKKPNRILFVSGKLYWELKRYQETLGSSNKTLLVRIEQLYPFAQKEISDLLAMHVHADMYWIQEEPRNNGAFLYMKDCFAKYFKQTLKYIGRKECSSVALGSLKVHKLQQQKIIEAAFAKDLEDNIEV